MESARAGLGIRVVSVLPRLTPATELGAPAVAAYAEREGVDVATYRQAKARALIERYASRMNIEQRLAETIRAFHIDALSSAVPLNVDLDVVLSVLAGAVCAAFRRRLRGHQSATPDTLQRARRHGGRDHRGDQADADHESADGYVDLNAYSESDANRAGRASAVRGRLAHGRSLSTGRVALLAPEEHYAQSSALPIYR